MLDISGARKIAAKVRISLMTLFPSLQVIDSGCCTVAAHESSPCPKPAAFPLVPLRLQSQGTVKADIEGWLTPYGIVGSYFEQTRKGQR